MSQIDSALQLFNAYDGLVVQDSIKSLQIEEKDATINILTTTSYRKDSLYHLQEQITHQKDSIIVEKKLVNKSQKKTIRKQKLIIVGLIVLDVLIILAIIL